MTAAVDEQAVVFGCKGERLVGVLHVPPPEQVSTDMAVVVVVGGPQYRAGSHRQFVLLARALAAQGYPVLRFDYRGMGDSSGALHTFEYVSTDIGASVDLVQQRLPWVRRVVLWGLCDGASAALLYCSERRDHRIAGLCLLNPWARSEVSLARTHIKHYYVQRLTQRDFWAKLLRGKVGPSAVQGLARDVGRARNTVLDQDSYQRRMASGWRGFVGKILLVLSGNDYTAKEFLDHLESSPDWAGSLNGEHVERRDVPDADHTFSSPQAGTAVMTLTLDWLTRA